MKTQMQQRQVGEFEWVGTVLGMALLLGTAVRLLPAYLVGFPLNDGGMFLAMTQDLRVNGFVLPVYTAYNRFAIPYAYPPLGFYIGGMLEQVGISALWIFTWLPAIFTVLSIPLFYGLARQLTGERPHAALATAFFALTPGNYAWLLMGGGLTRALGTLFFLAALTFILQTFRAPSWKMTGLAAIFCALVVLSHPQRALLTALSSLVFGAFLIRSWKAVLHAFVIGLGTLALTSPWWGFVLTHHGIAAFLSAGQSSSLDMPFRILWDGLFSLQTILPVLPAFCLLGAGWAVYKRRFDLLVWGFLPYLVDQRSAPIVSSTLYPLLAAYGFLDVLPALVDFLRTRRWSSAGEFMNRQALSLGLLGVLFYLFFECAFYDYNAHHLSLTPAAREMTAWVREGTPQAGRFLILTSHLNPMTDPLQEWFPVLTERHSATTLQGLEWTLKKEFNTRWGLLLDLQSCLNRACVDEKAAQLEIEYQYVILDMTQPMAGLLPSYLDQGAREVYRNEQYAVIKR